MTASRMVRVVAVALAVSSAACGAGKLKPKAGVFWSEQQPIKVAASDVSLTLVRPVSPNPPPFLVMFASGDGAWSGTIRSRISRPPHLSTLGVTPCLALSRHGGYP